MYDSVIKYNIIKYVYDSVIKYNKIECNKIWIRQCNMCVRRCQISNKKNIGIKSKIIYTKLIKIKENQNLNSI